ncbi:hypothetical protein DMC30DRAFT_396412 [Rhodotorula diobovata]|uniref:CSC1/OSCA1-like N-terminal transmembrane domain-containing protein n=1 Tax=Rhodotorula diobovata TaxID=5288 RepID=A0A5C5FXW0_9BASI|nr:hypothetical protein DMC30DRAFT_396412 [Rhodotorula diobovata]
MSAAAVQNEDVTNKSTQTFITALVTGLIVLGAEVLAFVIIKNRFRQIYSPRSYRVPPRSVAAFELARFAVRRGGASGFNCEDWTFSVALHHRD